MPIPSPFHSKTSRLCTSLRWKEWAGYHAVCSFDTCHEREYFAFRHAVGMIDITPLFKYEVHGKDAGIFLSRVMVKNIAKLKRGQVTYCCWCDDAGKVVDDGTVTRLAKDRFRVTAAEPSLAWFLRYTSGYAVTVEDISQKVAALAVQGPNSRALLKSACDADLDKLRFFRMTPARLGNMEVTITRTGYTGDLGYELWTDERQATALWDVLTDAGKAFGLEPCGLDALDVTRVEAGFIMNGVDYFSAHHCLIESRKSTPYELGLGWTVQLEREPFNGQAALIAEKRAGSSWCLAGLEIEWEAYEKLCAGYGLPPQVSSGAWRTGVPVYDRGGKQIGYATSGAWSPILKKNLALATLQTPHGRLGNKLLFEVTVEYHRHQIPATVVETPFFNPERKRS